MNLPNAGFSDLSSSFQPQRFRKIWIVGASGSGKSSLAARLSEFLKVPVIKTTELVARFLSTRHVSRAWLESLYVRAARAPVDGDKTRLAEIDLYVTWHLSDACRNTKVAIVDSAPRTLQQLHLIDPVFDRVVHVTANFDVRHRRVMARTNRSAELAAAADVLFPVPLFELEKTGVEIRVFDNSEDETS